MIKIYKVKEMSKYEMRSFGGWKRQYERRSEI